MEFGKYFSIAKKEVKEAIVDNKRLIIVMAALFIVSLILSWIFHAQILGNFTSNSHTSATHVSKPAAMNPALDIFIHNEFAGIQTYFLSIFFGIDAFFSVIFNGVLLGAIGGDVNGGSLVYAVAMFLALVVPHGIFEIPATIFESVAGVLLFLFIFRFFKTIYTTKDISDFKLKAKNSWNVNKVYLKQSIVLMIFCCVLLVIAAIIEAYITDYVGNWVESFFR